MSVIGIYNSGIYRGYKAWIFLKDWMLMSLVLLTVVFMGEVVYYLGWAFVDWNDARLTQFITEGWWLFRLCAVTSLITGFLISIYLFPDSYDNSIKELGERS